MSRHLMQRIFVVVVCALLGAVTIMPSVLAQPTEVNGTSDFRNPPTLTPGTFTDTIVTGETVWYAVVYTNNTPYRFEATLPGVDIAADEEISLEIAFIGPTLGVLTRDAQVVEGPGASYNGGQTNVWYITVSLRTEGRLGVEYDLTLDIAGVEEARFDDCTQLPDCDLDEQLADIEQRIVETQELIGAIETDDAGEVIAAEIVELEEALTLAEARRGLAESATTNARRQQEAAAAEIATICAPDPTCTAPPQEPGTTPTWALAAGGIVLAAGAGLGLRRLVAR